MVGHTRRQLQFIGFGAATSYYLGTFQKLRDILVRNEPYSSPWLSISLALLSAAVTTLCFLYVLVYLPRVKGVRVDYRRWQESELKWVVPLLTASIMAGWSSFLFALWQYSSLNLLWGALADVGIYTLSFGIIGLIPPPTLSKPSGAQEKTS